MYGQISEVAAVLQKSEILLIKILAFFILVFDELFLILLFIIAFLLQGSSLNLRH